MMNRTKFVYVIATSLIILAVLIGFIAGRMYSDNREDTTNDEIRSSKYAMNVVVSGVPFWIESRETWEKVSEVFPLLETVYGGPLNTDAQSQITEIEQLLALNINGLVVAPSDSDALTNIINKSIDGGIPVVTYLTDSENSKRLTYITSELETAGEKIGDYIAEQAGHKGKVVISYAETGNYEQESRARGIRSAIEKHQSMEIFKLIEDKYDEQRAAELIKSLLSQQDDVTAILGCNSRSAAGAVIALREMGYKPGQVAVSGWDFDDDLLNLVEQGWIQGSVAQNSEFMTYLAFAVLEGYTRGLIKNNEDGIRLPDRIEIPISVITQNNYKNFRRKR